MSVSQMNYDELVHRINQMTDMNIELRRRAIRTAETIKTTMNYSLLLNIRNENIKNIDDFKIIDTFNVSPQDEYVPKMIRKEMNDFLCVFLSNVYPQSSHISKVIKMLKDSMISFLYVYLTYVEQELREKHIVEKDNKHML